MDKADRTCSLCGKVFNYPSQLARHSSSKRKCVPAFAKKKKTKVAGSGPSESTPSESTPSESAPSVVCKYCGTTFTKKTHMYRHIRNSCKIAPNLRNGMDGMARLYSLIKEKEMAEAGRSSAVGGRSDGPERVAPIRIDARGANLNTTINITINVFGNESLNHITCGMIYKIMEPFINIHPDEATVQIILGLATVIYSDPEHPENITCYLPGESPNALVHEGMGWKIKPVTMVLPPMLAKSVQLALDKQPWPGESDTPDNADIDSSQKIIGQLRETPLNATRRLLGPTGELRGVLVRNRIELSKVLGDPAKDP